jgi:hypothetical protein
MSNNHLSKDKQIAVTAALAEGNSIRSIERMTGIHWDTIMRLGVRIGQGCARVLDERLRNLECKQIELDEIWGFVGKKMRHVQEGDDPTYGEVWGKPKICNRLGIASGYVATNSGQGRSSSGDYECERKRQR